MLRSLLGNYGKSELRWARFVIALLLFTFLPSFRAAESPSHFEQANRLYEQGKYPEAISLYESMIKGGFNSPGVYFNLGNAHFKQGSLGRALANYRQAARLSPRDPDIQANLPLTRERVSGSVSSSLAWGSDFSATSNWMKSRFSPPSLSGPCHSSLG